MIRVKLTGKSLEEQFEALVKAKKEETLDKAVVKLKENTPVDTGEAAAGWSHNGKTIVNDVEHISDLNSGSSQQAPAFFVEETLLGIPGISSNGTIVRPK